MGNLVIGPAPSSVSLKSIFRTPVTGAEWPKRFLVGSLLILGGYIIPILPAILVSGYGIRVMRTAIRMEELALPPWDDWGKLAWDGLRASAISLIFLLPGMLVLFGGFGVYFSNFFTFPILGALVENSRLPEGVFALVILGSFFIFFASIGLGSLLLLIGSIPLPMVIAHFAATDRFSAVIQIGTWLRLIWRNKLGYLIAWVIVFGISGILYFTIFLGYYLIFPICFAPILLPPLLFFIIVVIQALFGEAYRESSELLN